MLKTIWLIFQGWLFLVAMVLFLKIVTTAVFGYSDCGYGDWNFIVCYR